MHWRMLVFSDLQRLSVPAQFFAFSDAYLDSAVSLCDALCATSATVTYAHGAAVMSLTFHSIELFLKAAILQRSPGEQFSGSRGHNLDHLYQRYANLYPGKAYTLDLPFKRQEPDIEGLDSRLAEELLAFIQQQEKAMPHDQMHRYPTDVNGHSWKTLLGFEPHSFRLVSSRSSQISYESGASWNVLNCLIQMSPCDDQITRHGWPDVGRYDCETVFSPLSPAIHSTVAPGICAPVPAA